MMKRGIDTLLASCHSCGVTNPSPLYRMIERRLQGQTLAEFVAARRTDRSWATRSWAAMAAEITDLTDIEVSDETLRRWFSSTEPTAASPPPPPTPKAPPKPDRPRPPNRPPNKPPGRAVSSGEEVAA